MNPLAVAALAGGAVLVIHETSKATDTSSVPKTGRVSLDPGMDSMIAEAIALAVQSETQSEVLDDFAAKLKAAGYPNSATAVSAASTKLKGLSK